MLAQQVPCYLATCLATYLATYPAALLPCYLATLLPTLLPCYSYQGYADSNLACWLNSTGSLRCNGRGGTLQAGTDRDWTNFSSWEDFRQGKCQLLHPAPPYYPFPRGKSHTRCNT